MFVLSNPSHSQVVKNTVQVAKIIKYRKKKQKEPEIIYDSCVKIKEEDLLCRKRFLIAKVVVNFLDAGKSLTSENKMLC